MTRENFALFIIQKSLFCHNGLCDVTVDVSNTVYNNCEALVFFRYKYSPYIFLLTFTLVMLIIVFLMFFLFASPPFTV